MRLLAMVHHAKSRDGVVMISVETYLEQGLA